MRTLSALLFCGLLTACGGSAYAPSSRDAVDANKAVRSPIEHVVLIVQENRTFNDFFATFPGADGTTTGKAAPDPACHIRKEKTIALKERNLVMPSDLNHSYPGYVVARNAGAMDGFDKVLTGAGTPECTYPYQYTNPSQITPYWQMAQQYALAEHMFTTQGSSSFTAHQDLIAGGTVVSPNEAMVDLPSCSGSNCIWGCDAPSGTHTSLITRHDVFQRGKGPFPCVNYATLRDVLDAKDVSWRYYVPPMCCAAYGKLLSAFDAIKAVRYGSEWTDGHISSPQTNIFQDLTKPKFPAVSWVIPDENESDHPGTHSDTGPSWVASVVNAIGESSYWKSTAIVVVWDDWGGLYDNLNPKQVGYGGLGFRVPAMIVSAYTKPAYISKTDYDFGSILRYIEENWSLGTLGGDDKNAQSIIDCFDYSQPPITFQPIPSSHTKAYFLKLKVPSLPPDTDM
jgi:phospholipase C